MGGVLGIQKVLSGRGGLGVEESLCAWEECLEVKLRSESWGMGECEHVKAGEQMGELLYCSDGERKVCGLLGDDSASGGWLETILDATALAFSLAACSA